MTSSTVMVLGATGTQGGAVCRHVSRGDGFRIVAITRNPNSEQAMKMAELSHLELVRCNADNPAELEQVFFAHTPLYGVFSVQANDYTDEGCAKEIEQGKRVVDLCEQFAVKHLVYSSVAQLSPAKLPDVATKIEIEAYLRASRVPFTVLRPTFFMDNFFDNRYAVATRAEVGYPGFKSTNPVKQKYIYVDDLGRIAAQVFAEHEAWVGRTLELAGDALAPSDLMATFSEYTGQPMSALEIACDEWGVEIEPLFVAMRAGLWDEVDIEALRKEFPFLHTFEGALKHSGFRPPQKR